jgi:hypothetical protein
MKLYPLLAILPPELVKIIYTFIKIDKSKKIIYKHFQYHLLKKKVINDIIFDFCYPIDLSFVVNTNINNFKFLINNRLGKYYNRYFWSSLLALISDRLMNHYIYLNLNNEVKNRKQKYKNLNKLIALWFQLCQKYNMILDLTYYNFKSRKACEPIIKPARYLNSIKSFHNLVYAPSIIYTMSTMIYLNNYNNIPINVLLTFV